ncbi:hypothetical protein B1F68_01405, partial [Pseudomonas syringae]
GAWVKGGGVKSPTGLYCANSQKRTKSLLLPSSLTIQANLFAKAGNYTGPFANKFAPTASGQKQKRICV